MFSRIVVCGVLVSLSVSILLWSGTVVAQQGMPSDHGSAETSRPLVDSEISKPGKTVAMPEVAITATRSERPVASIPEAVTVITREDIEKQAVLTRDVGELLGKLTPGLAPGNQSLSNFGQVLRGRNALVIIDGVPQGTARNAGRDLRTIDPSAIERIEIVRGATSIYGDGATGGIIHIITKKPVAGKPTFTTDLLTSAAATNPTAGLGGRIVQSMAGKKGAFDYSLSGSYERTGGYFDAAGSRIPPDLQSAQGGLSDLNTYNLFGKLGYEFAKQRLQLTANRFVSSQDTDYATDPSVNAFPPKTQKARTRQGLQLNDQPGIVNTLVNVDYNHADLFGSRLHVQGYYRNYSTRFFPFDGRTFAANPFIFQSRVESEKVGSRLEIDTPLPVPGIPVPRLLWGMDFIREVTAQRAAIMDPAAYDSSSGLVFNQTGDRIWVPPMTQRNIGLFAQLEWSPFARWVLRGGVRHERVDLDVSSFTTLAGNPIASGGRSFNATLFNAGTVVYLTDEINVFGSFAQGFSIPDTGLILRAAPAGFRFSSSQLAPIKVNHYEIGVRGDWSRIQPSLSVYYNESDLGVTSGGFFATIIRAPERVYGLEGTLDIQPIERWRLGGTFTWTEGENDPDLNGDYTALNGFRIAPLKLTGYIEHDTVPAWQWRNRLQVLYVGGRDPGLAPSVFGGRPVDHYTLVDFISTAKVGPGFLHFGIENLLNNEYFNTISQLLRTGRNDSYTAARGMVISLGYTFKY
jgi:iron complex outermembrane receptor protein